jgi:hypothetical protein
MVDLNTDYDTSICKLLSFHTGTPDEDMSHVRAVQFLSSDKVKAKYIIVIGTNIEVGHGVLQSDIDARLCALSRYTLFKWLLEYENDDDVRRYVDIFSRHSIVHIVCYVLHCKVGEITIYQSIYVVVLRSQLFNSV